MGELWIVECNAVFEQGTERGLVFFIGMALKSAHANVRVTQPDEDGRARGRGLIVALECFTGLKQGKAF